MDSVRTRPRLKRVLSEGQDVARLGMQWLKRNPQEAEPHLVDSLKLVRQVANDHERPLVDFTLQLLKSCHSGATRNAMARDALASIASGVDFPHAIDRMLHDAGPDTAEARLESLVFLQQQAAAGSDMAAALDLWSVGLEANFCGSTADEATRAALDCLESGKISARDRCGLAARMLDHAAESDKFILASRLHQVLDMEAPELAGPLGVIHDALDGVGFSNSLEDMSVHGWEAIQAGAGQDFAGTARLCQKLLDGACTGQSTTGQSIDDKGVVLDHVLSTLNGAVRTDADRLVLTVWQKILTQTDPKTWPDISDTALEMLGNGKLPSRAFKALAALPFKPPMYSLVLNGMGEARQWPKETALTFKMARAMMDRMHGETSLTVLGIMLDRLDLQGLDKPLDPWRLIDELWKQCGTLEVRNAIVEAAFPVLHQAGCDNPQKETELTKNVVQNHEAGGVQDDDGGVTIGGLKLPQATINCNKLPHVSVLF